MQERSTCLTQTSDCADTSSEGGSGYGMILYGLDYDIISERITNRQTRKRVARCNNPVDSLGAWHLYLQAYEHKLSERGDVQTGERIFSRQDFLAYKAEY